MTTSTTSPSVPTRSNAATTQCGKVARNTLACERPYSEIDRGDRTEVPLSLRAAAALSLSAKLAANAPAVPVKKDRRETSIAPSLHFEAACVCDDKEMSNATGPNPDGSSPQQRKFAAKHDLHIDPTKRYTATMETSVGTVVIALDAAGAPETVNNFVTLARYHYYDGLVFHRIIQGFMCQGGCPQGTGTGGPGYKFNDELPKPGRYEIGSLAMANAGPNTNGSQFFIVSGRSGVGLPPSYSLFGKVVKGLEIVDEMEKVPTDRSDRPLTPVTINSVTITEAD